MPNKSRIYAVVLIALTLASTFSISSLTMASPPQLPEANTPATLNGIGVQVNQQVNPLAGAGNSIFLPIVSNMPAGIAVSNGDFESGPTIWTEFSTNSRNLILSDNDLPVAPHSGSWAAWLGGVNDDISYIEQTLTIPTSAPYLTYWHWIDSIENICGIDFAGVYVGTFLEDVYDLCTANNTSGWVTYSVDLSSYAGQTRTIQIWVETNSNKVSSLYVDDVSFKSYPAPSSLIKTRKVEK